MDEALMQWATLGMFLACADWDGDPEAYLDLDRAAEVADLGVSEARWQILGAQEMIAVLDRSDRDQAFMASLVQTWPAHERLASAAIH